MLAAYITNLHICFCHSIMRIPRKGSALLFARTWNLHFLCSTVIMQHPSLLQTVSSLTFNLQIEVKVGQTRPFILFLNSHQVAFFPSLTKPACFPATGEHKVCLGFTTKKDSSPALLDAGLLLSSGHCYFFIATKFGHRKDPFQLLNHRTIGWPGLKRTTMLIQFQPPAMCRVTNQQPRLPRATSSLALNASRDEASTTSSATCFSVSPPPV